MEKFEKFGELYRRFTIREFIDAMEESRIRQSFGTLFKTTEGHSTAFPENIKPGEVIEEACALGQAYINLGISDLQGGGANFYAGNLRSTIIGANDTSRKTIPQIVTLLRTRYADQLDLQLEGRVKNYEAVLSQ